MEKFVINLDRSPERLRFMKEQFARLGIEVERVAAVDGRQFPNGVPTVPYAKWRSYVSLQRRMSPAMIAVAASHLGICRKMTEQNIPCALVLEDDVVLEDGFMQALERVEATLDPMRPQVYSFNGYGLADADRARHEIRPVGKMWCADAYVVTVTAAQAILRANSPIVTVADDFKRFHRKFGVELYRVLPATVRQDNEQFATENQESPKAPWYLRLIMRPLDWLLWRLTGR